MKKSHSTFSIKVRSLRALLPMDRSRNRQRLPLHQRDAVVWKTGPRMPFWSLFPRTRRRRLPQPSREKGLICSIKRIQTRLREKGYRERTIKALRDKWQALATMYRQVVAMVRQPCARTLIQRCRHIHAWNSGRVPGSSGRGSWWDLSRAEQAQSAGRKVGSRAGRGRIVPHQPHRE